MARGINKAILIGNLGNEPEVRYMASGQAVANVSIATNESWKDRETGETKERTEWHRVVFYAKLAEIVRDYLHKGSQVYVEGRIQTRKWQDKDGHERYSTEIVANEMQMLGGRGTPGPDMESRGEPGAQGPAAPPQAPAAGPEPGDVDDDIPF